jgi:chromate transporter
MYSKKEGSDMKIEKEKRKEKNSQSISYLQLFWTFFQVGLLTLGGGMVMTTVLRHELVLKRKWITDDDFMAEFSTATLVPGAIAVNFAYLQGRLLRGKRGAFFSVMGTILPSVCIILLIAIFAVPYFSNPRVAAFLKGCALAVVGQLAFAGFTFGKKHLRNWQNILICGIGLIIVAVFQFHPIWTIVVAGALGYFFCNMSNLLLNDGNSKDK